MVNHLVGVEYFGNEERTGDDGAIDISAVPYTIPAWGVPSE